MKFWELVSVFRGTDVLTRVLTQEPWRSRLSNFDELVSEQARDILNATVPEELARRAASLSSLRFWYFARDGTLRQASTQNAPREAKVLSVLQVYDRFGGSIIEEALEHGSATAKP